MRTRQWLIALAAALFVIAPATNTPSSPVATDGVIHSQHIHVLADDGVINYH